MLNIALPKLGPHNHPPAATAAVEIPSTMIGSSPDICAPQESKSWAARIGVTRLIAVNAVMPEQPRLIHRRFLRRSKKRFQVRMCSGTDASESVAGDVDAQRSPIRVEGSWCVGNCEGDALGVNRGCLDTCVAVVKVAVKSAGAKRPFPGVLTARRQLVRVQRSVAMVDVAVDGSVCRVRCFRSRRQSPGRQGRKLVVSHAGTCLTGVKCAM